MGTVNAIAPITPEAVAPVQPTAAAVSAFEAAVEAENDEVLFDTGTTTQASASSANGDSASLDGAVLSNLSPQALIVLSEANNAVAAPSVGNLTPAQLEEINTLEADAQILNTVTATQTFTDDGSLLDGASTVNLSAQAIDILNGVNAGTGIAATATATLTGAFTPAQLQQLAGILTPFINAPLTPSTFTQIQNALVAAGFNPVEISVQNILLAMNYVGEYLPTNAVDNEVLIESEAMTTELLDS